MTTASLLMAIASVGATTVFAQPASARTSPGACYWNFYTGGKRCFNSDGSYCDYGANGVLLKCHSGNSGW